MYVPDREAFTCVMQQLGTAFNKPPTDEICAMYWNALKDLPIGTVVAHANTHMRYGKHFPRPSELRPKDDKPPKEHRADAAFEEGERRANERLESLRKSDLEEWYRQVSPKVYEIGRAKGMLDGEIEAKLQSYMSRP